MLGFILFALCMGLIAFICINGSYEDRRQEEINNSLYDFEAQFSFSEENKLNKKYDRNVHKRGK